MPEINKTNNAILAALPPETFEQLASKLASFQLVYNTDIHSVGDVIDHVYFPESGIISLLAVVGPDSTIEVGMIGDEGMYGIPVFLGESVSNNQAVVQGSGFAKRMTASDFLYESDRSTEFSRILKKFAYSMMTQIAQSAACNRYHPIEARFARWLLLTRDRIRSDEFKITQDFLSNMIGVRREAVNKIGREFQKRGLISSARGSISILKPKELRSLACVCYRINAAK